MNNSTAVCAARCWEARKINWFCHEYPGGLFVSNAEQGSTESQERDAERRVGHLHRTELCIRVANVECVFAAVTVWWTNRARSWQRQLQAGKYSPLWQAAGACGLFNIPSNSCYMTQIRHHPEPNTAPSSSQGEFQRNVWGLFWAIPGSPSHL